MKSVVVVDYWQCAVDADALADITSLLTADLAPNASGWVVDLFGLF